jgi:hypothetical protein
VHVKNTSATKLTYVNVNLVALRGGKIVASASAVTDIGAHASTFDSDPYLPCVQGVDTVKAYLG